MYVNEKKVSHYIFYLLVKRRKDWRFPQLSSPREVDTFPLSLCVSWAITSCCPHGRREAAEVVMVACKVEAAWPWGALCAVTLTATRWAILKKGKPNILQVIKMLWLCVCWTWGLLQGRWFPWQTQPQQHGKDSGLGSLKPSHSLYCPQVICLPVLFWQRLHILAQTLMKIWNLNVKWEVVLTAYHDLLLGWWMRSS